MKRSFNFFGAISMFVLFGCNSETSLQEYYVENQSKEDFVVFNIPSALFLGTNDELTEAEKEKLRSVEKANIIAFPITDKTEAIFEAEKIKVEHILKNEKYKLLMQFASSGNKMQVMYTGETESIDEMIFFGASKDYGFAVARVLGDDMDPQAIVDYIRNFNSESNEGNNLDSSQLENLMEVFRSEGMQELKRTDNPSSKNRI